MIKDLEEAAKHIQCFEFAMANGAELVSYRTYVMECPNCHETKCFFDHENFLCYSCNQRGTFEKLKQLVTALQGEK